MNDSRKATHASSHSGRSLPQGALDRGTLERIFRHPAAQNIHWDDAVALFETIGNVEHTHSENWMFHIGAESQVVQRPHTKDLTGAEVIELRKLLKRAGWSAEGDVGSPAATGAGAPDLIVVVDHHEAKIYRVSKAADDAVPTQIEPYDPHHFLHHLTHRDQDREPGQRAPEDPSFYVRIAAALATGGSIVVVGHGAGHSNAARHLLEHLQSHDPEIYARVVREVVADLSSVTPAQLLDIARQKGR